MTSYLMGSLRTDFAHMKNRIKASCGAADMGAKDSLVLVKHLLEELLRYFSFDQQRPRLPCVGSCAVLSNM